MKKRTHTDTQSPMYAKTVAAEAEVEAEAVAAKKNPNHLIRIYNMHIRSWRLPF